VATREEHHDRRRGPHGRPASSVVTPLPLRALGPADGTRRSKEKLRAPVAGSHRPGCVVPTTERPARLIVRFPEGVETVPSIWLLEPKDAAGAE
jgi:hypothetical protein